MNEELNNMENKEKDNGSKKNNILTIACMAVSSLLIIACALYFVLPYLKTKEKPNEDNSDNILKQSYLNPFSANLSTLYRYTVLPDNFNKKFEAIYSLNSDTIGWLSIPNLNIDDVVMFTPNDKTNSYYLRKDMFGNYYLLGTLYADFRCSFGKDSFSKNTIIYGHYFKEEIPLIFTNLDEYRTIEGYQKAPLIIFNTIYGEYKWKVFAAFTTTAYPEGDNGYNFNYFYPNMSDEKTSGYLAEVKKRSFYFTNVDVQPTDKFLTLSTCCHDYVSSKLTENQGKGRLVIVARLLRDGESEEVDTTNIKLNTNRYESQSYYTKYGKVNPWSRPTWTPY